MAEIAIQQPYDHLIQKLAEGVSVRLNFSCGHETTVSERASLEDIATVRRPFIVACPLCEENSETVRLEIDDGELLVLTTGESEIASRYEALFEAPHVSESGAGVSCCSNGHVCRVGHVTAGRESIHVTNRTIETERYIKCKECEEMAQLRDRYTNADGAVVYQLALARDSEAVSGTRFCEDCMTVLTDDDKYEGPEEPQVGWEYYRCSECDAVYHPEVIERWD